MKEWIRGHLPFGQSSSIALKRYDHESQDYRIRACRISPEDLAASDLKDAAFLYYSFSVTDKANGLTMDVRLRKHQEEIHGLPFPLSPQDRCLSTISLSIQVPEVKLEYSTDEPLLKLNQSAEKVRVLLGGIWVRQKQLPMVPFVNILLHPSIDSSDGSWTQRDVGLAAQSLIQQGFDLANPPSYPTALLPRFGKRRNRKF